MEKSKMREILDMFEEAGFTVTSIRHSEAVDDPLKPRTRLHVSLSPTGIKKGVQTYEEGSAMAGDIVSLIEKNNYRLFHFEIKDSNYLLDEYAEIVSFTMIPALT
jgi:hypothetical protein